MASVHKPAKEKLHGASPKILPRATAASQARAARIASNRTTGNQNLTKSPTRPPSSPGPLRGKSTSSIQNRVPTFDSRMSINSNKPQQRIERNCDRLIIDHLPNSTMDSDENNIKVNESRIIIVDDPDDQTYKDTRDHFESVPVNCSSKPGTPKNSFITPANNYGDTRPITPGSRPATPLRCRPRTPNIVQTPITETGDADAFNQEFSQEKGDLKEEYLRKQKQFQHMKKELDFKQQTVLETFANLKRMKEDLCQENMMSGDENVTHQDLLIVNVADWAAEEILQICREAANNVSANESDKVFNNITLKDENIFNDIIKKINDVPDQFENTCLQVFASRQEVIDWAKDIVCKEEDGEINSQKLNDYSIQGGQLYEALLSIKNDVAISTETAVTFLKNTYKDCNVLHATGENILRELEKFKRDMMEQRNKKLTDISEHEESDFIRELEETQKELEQERLSKATIKNKLSATESQLRAARTRVSKMEKQIQEAEASIVSLTSTVKSLEEQNRHNEIQLEAKARKMRESLKIGDEKRNLLSDQREKLNNEIQELKEAKNKMEEGYKNVINELTSKLNNLASELEVKSKQINEEVGAKIKAEENVFKYQQQLNELNNKLLEIENNKFNPDIHSLREMELMAELETIKEALRTAEKEIEFHKKEKIQMLKNLSTKNNSEQDTTENMQNKLTQELINKEDFIGKLQSQIRDLIANSKLNEEKVFQYEQFLSDQYAFNKAISTNELSQPDSLSNQNLQREVINLRVNLVEAMHKNEQLEEELQQRKQQIEQQEKASRSQAKVIKVRDQLIEVLENKDSEQRRELAALQRDIELRMKIVEDVNKQIAAKGEEIQEVFATLETKQQHIHRLEKIVLALEDHQRRAQAQRVRNEEKIALLEHELANINNKRDRKFLFF